MYIFLDESGDLGFDLSKEGTSKHFTISLLVVENSQTLKAIQKAVKRTLDNKVNAKRKKQKNKNLLIELKATDMPIGHKQYFLERMPETGWHIYSITLNKQRVYDNLKHNKPRLYNYIVKELIGSLPKYESLSNVHLTIDNCKNKSQRKDFNQYIEAHLETNLSPKTQIHISHENSQNNKCLQAIDLFCWGIQRKYELKDTEWLELYEKNISKHIPYLF